MPQDLRDQWWVLDAGDHSELATAFRASLDVDGEDPFEPLYPTHGCHGLVMLHRALCSSRYDAFAMLEVWCEHPVEASEVQSWAWDQCGQAGNKIQRFQHDMGRTIAGRWFRMSVSVDLGNSVSRQNWRWPRPCSLRVS